MGLLNLPEHIIKTVPFTYNCAGIDLDFTVSCTIFGELLNIESAYFDLPPSAKQMIYGQEVMLTVEKDIIGWMKAMSIFLPLEIKGLVEIKNWDIIKLANESSRTEANKIEPAIYPKMIQDKWVLKLWELGAKLPNHLMAFCKMMARVDNETKNRFAAYYLYTYRPREAAESYFFGEFLLMALKKLKKEGTITQKLSLLIPRYLSEQEVTQLAKVHDFDYAMKKIIAQSFMEEKYHEGRKMMYKTYVQHEIGEILTPTISKIFIST